MDNAAAEAFHAEFAAAFREEADAGPAGAAAERIRTDADAAAAVRESPGLMRLLRRAVGAGGALCDAAAIALEACAEGVAKPRGVIHQVYTFPGGLKVPIRELGTGDDRLGEGGCVWGAAMLLAAHLCLADAGAATAAAAADDTASEVAEPVVSAPRVRGQSVLELGAGCGLCGVVAAALGARRAVLSEVAEPALIENLRANIALQAPEVAGRCAAAALDWEKDGDDAGDGSDRAGGNQAGPLPWVSPTDTFDVIIGSDLLLGAYKSVELLPGVVSRHLAPGGRAALLNAVRSRDRLEALLRGFAAAGLEARHRELSRAEVEAGFRCGSSVDGARTAETYEGGFVIIDVRRPGRRGS